MQWLGIMGNSGANVNGTKERNERQLCLNCLAPNSTLANFCHDCGAPLSSFAATGPMESVLAEGHVYRRAVESPRSWIVVLGVWMIFGMMLFNSWMPWIGGSQMGTPEIIWSLIMLPLPLAVLWKTTKGFLTRRR